MPSVSAALVGLPNKPHALYRFYDRTDVLLYVGITMDLPARMTSHRRGKPWWLEVHHITIEHFDTRVDALAAEASAIRAEGPLYNVTGNARATTVEGESEWDCECQGSGDLGVTILDLLTPFERELAIGKAESLPASERVYEYQPAEAGRVAAEMMVETRLQLDAAIFGLLRVLPEPLSSEITTAALADIHRHLGEEYTDYDVTANALHHLSRRVAELFPQASEVPV